MTTVIRNIQVSGIDQAGEDQLVDLIAILRVTGFALEALDSSGMLGASRIIREVKFQLNNLEESVCFALRKYEEQK
jgi:hypothetical protein